MTHLAGRGGDVSIGPTAGTSVAGVKSWTLDYTVDIHDTSDFADGGTSPYPRTFLPGLSSWSGSFEVVKDSSPQTLGVNSTPINLNLEEVAGTLYWRGTAFITGIHASVSVEGIVMYTYDFQGTAELSTAGL